MNDFQRAMERDRKDARAHAIARTVAARVIAEHGPIDRSRADREAHDIAIKVAAVMLEQIYNGDAELLALRAELEATRERYLELANLTPRPSIIDAATFAAFGVKPEEVR